MTSLGWAFRCRHPVDVGWHNGHQLHNDNLMYGIWYHWHHHQFYHTDPWSLIEPQKCARHIIIIIYYWAENKPPALFLTFTIHPSGISGLFGQKGIWFCKSCWLHSSKQHPSGCSKNDIIASWSIRGRSEPCKSEKVAWSRHKDKRDRRPHAPTYPGLP